VERLDQLRRLASVVQFMIGIAFAIVAMAIIGVTIRMTVLQRAREISIMRLVGATNNFIRGPFVLEGAIKGILGGVLAVALCWAGFALFKAALGTDLPDLKFFRPLDMVVIVLFGTLIGLLGSLLSVGRHLKAV
jgi:cell division transport system permease protein